MRAMGWVLIALYDLFWEFKISETQCPFQGQQDRVYYSIRSNHVFRINFLTHSFAFHLGLTA